MDVGFIVFNLKIIFGYVMTRGKLECVVTTGMIEGKTFFLNVKGRARLEIVGDTRRLEGNLKYGHITRRGNLKYVF